MNEKILVSRVLHYIEQVGLVVILIATLVAVGQEVALMLTKGHVDLKDLLLLFIYLEIVAMVRVYYQEHRLPIRYPIYIAIVALARYIILDSKSLAQWQLLEIAVTIVSLTVAVFIVRYGHVRFPYKAAEKKK